jgi:putative transposase
MGGPWYHAVNPDNCRQTVLHQPGDYDAFVAAMLEAGRRVAVGLLGYCLIPNHTKAELISEADLMIVFS